MASQAPSSGPVTQPDEPNTIEHQRSPLTSLYGPFIAPGDQSLEDARSRLQTALRQTRRLQNAFTERVFQKYRVSLAPTENIDAAIERIKRDPTVALKNVQQQIQNIHKEKQEEKKEPEDLHYVTAGLHLVVTNEVNKVQDRKLSQASLMAGDAVIERTRRAKAARIERHKRQHLQLLSNESTESGNGIHATVPQMPRKPNTTLTVGSLLSLHPLADQVGGQDEPSASLAALTSRMNIPKTTQQRLKHPFPTSLGGQRRSIKTPQQEPVSPSVLELALPPLPQPKETKTTASAQMLPRPTESRKDLLQILHPFLSENGELKSVTKLQLLHSLRMLERKEDPKRTIDPVLAFSVMHSIGLIHRKADKNSVPHIEVEDEPHLDELHQRMVQGPTLIGMLQGEKMPEIPTVQEQIPPVTAAEDVVLAPFVESSNDTEKRQRSEHELESKTEPPTKKTKTENSRSTANGVPIESLRGGGGESDNNAMQSPKPPAKPLHESEQIEGIDATPQQPNEPSTLAPTGTPTNVSVPPTVPATNLQAQSPTFSTPASAALQGTVSGGALAYLQSLQTQQQGFDFSSAIQTAGTMGIYGGDISSIYARDALLRSLATQAAAQYSSRIPSVAVIIGNPQVKIPSAQPVTMAEPKPVPPQSTASKPAGTVSTKDAPASKEHTPEEKSSHDHNILESDHLDLKPSAIPKEFNVKEMKPVEIVQDPVETSATKKSSGLQFTPPGRPIVVTQEEAKSIRAGRFGEIVSQYDDMYKRIAALDYLNAVSNAIPIPKVLVHGPLKDRLNTPNFKQVISSGAPSVPRDIIVSCILTWLWANSNNQFQAAFLKSGRIDVDPECKWLIQAAVDTSVRELSIEIADSMARNEGAFAEAATAKKLALQTKQAPATAQSESVELANAMKKVEICCALVVSRALMIELSVDTGVNTVVHKFSSALGYLDELRVAALRAKSRERTLLATLLARKATMTESFSHAYTSAMVRAGEALGHSKLFEVAQNEKISASTMVPYDIFTDENGEWEDPCKPAEGFTPGLSADDLVRRAHARAMIQKSLRKLQDRHGIRGGICEYGPYSDFAQADAVSSRTPPPSVLPQPTLARGLKRRVSSMLEPPCPPGTGSAPAASWSVYDPKHACPPLSWSTNDLGNTPYGCRQSMEKQRALSVSVASRVDPKSNRKIQRSMSVSNHPVSPKMSEENETAGGLKPSTQEIAWSDVAQIFQNVELPRRSPSSTKVDSHQATPAPMGGVIVAPFCRPFSGELPSDPDESDGEEDLSDETIVKKHQEVLDIMKERLNALLDARQKQQEQRRNRQKAQP